MNLEAMVGRLEGVRRVGNGWIARCPAHDDRSPSLSLGEGSDGRVLLYCHAGCTLDAVCAALGIRINELFNDPTKTSKPEPHIVTDARRQLDGLRSRLTPRDRERAVTVVLAHEANLSMAMARALALTVEGEVVQVALEREAE
jgi:hypothetical protein